MIKTVVREHHWTPHQVGVLSLLFEYDPEDTSNLDSTCLEFWYHDVIECDKQLKAKMQQKTDKHA